MQENMDNFIPKNAVKYCNRCKHQIPRTVKCKVHPDGISLELLVGRKKCEEFEKIEEK